MDIYLNAKPTAEQLSSLFYDDLFVTIIDDWEQSLESKEATHHVIMGNNESEFPVGLAFQVSAGEPEQWLLNAARQLSLVLSCKTLYTGCPLPNASPYHSVVFDEGKAYLASDLETRLANDGVGLVQLIRRLPVFDET